MMTVDGALTDADRDALSGIGVEIKYEAKLRSLVVVMMPEGLDETRVRALDFVVSLQASRKFRLV